MALKITARHGGAAAASLDDITARVPFLDGVPGTPIVQMGMSVQNGGASQGTILVPDPTANDDDSLYFPPHTQITLTEDATGDELMLAQGRLSSFSIGRAPGSEVDHEVEWSLTIDDANVDLRGLAFTEDWVRPVETGVERLYALALYTLDGTSSTRPDFGGKITYRPSTTIVISSSHLAPNSDNIVLPVKTYQAGAQPQDVLNDCATTEGKVYGVVPHHVGGASHLCLLYIKESDHSTYASAAKISDQFADWDPDDLTAPVWEPIWDQGKGQTVEGNQNISGLVSRYGPDDKVVISVDDTLGDDNEYWVDAYQDGDSVDSLQAANRVSSIIAYRSPFSETDSVSIEILPEQHALITAGMSIQIKAAPVNAGTVSTVGTYVDRRIVSLQWEPRANGKLHAVLQLNRPTRIGGVGRAQPASTTPTAAPNCGDTAPYAFALGVDGAGWTKQDDPDPPGHPLPPYKAINVSASGDHALLTHSVSGTGVEGPPGFFGDYYSGGHVTNDDYAPADPEEMLFRFTYTLLGNGTDYSQQPMSFRTGAASGAVIEPPNTGTSPNDGVIYAQGNTGGAVEVAWVQGQSYYLRWKDGNAKVWEVGDPEPGAWTVTGGNDIGPGQVQFELYPMLDAFSTPSQVEIESLTIFQAIADPFCLTDPGASPYFAKSDDPRFDTIVTDHGGLSGLGDDDHTQYIKDAEFTAKGDILAGTGSGTFDNLPVGTDGYVLKANSATSTGLEWDTETGGGGSGPFEDVDTFTWKFTAPATAIASTDESAYLDLSTNAVFMTDSLGDAIDLSAGKIITSSPLGLVLPVAAADPSGGDSEDGQVFRNNVTNRFRARQNGAWVDLVRGALTSRTSAVAIANTQTVVTSFAAQADMMEAGTTFRIKAFGRLTSGGTGGSSIFRCRIGTTTLTGNIPATLTIVNANSVTNAPFQVEMLVTVRTNGGSGTAIGNIEVTGGTTAAFTTAGNISAISATVTVDTTVNNLVEFTYISGNAGTTATFENVVLELLS